VADKELDWIDKKVMLTGIVEEYLTLDGKSWVGIRIDDGGKGKVLIINTKYVRKVKDENDPTIK